MASNLKSLGRRMKSWLRKQIDTALEGTHDHFAFYFPGKAGTLIPAVLNLFYAGIRFEKTESAALSALPKDAVIVYACKYRSRFEFLFITTASPGWAFPVRKSPLVSGRSSFSR